jgi:hypothetical protein
LAIYGRAKDTALGVDQAVDELLKELEPKLPPDDKPVDAKPSHSERTARATRAAERSLSSS